MVQHRAARFVLGRYGKEDSVTEMLTELNWNPLQLRRKLARLCQLYKMHSRITNINIDQILLEPDYIGLRDHEKKIRLIQSKLLFYHNSFFPKTIRDWNRLAPRIIQESHSVEQFRKLLL